MHLRRQHTMCGEIVTASRPSSPPAQLFWGPGVLGACLLTGNSLVRGDVTKRQAGGGRSEERSIAWVVVIAAVHRN